MHLGLLLYLFPPLGCLVVSFGEIGWVFHDIYLGISSFIQGEILIIDKDLQKTKAKQFRKVIEIFGESIPQSMVQLYMFFNLKSIDIDPFDLGISFAISMFNLIYNMYKLTKDAKSHGMAFAEYAVSVFQLSEVPILKLIPKLDGIRYGKVFNVNFSDFEFDKESVVCDSVCVWCYYCKNVCGCCCVLTTQGPIIQALSNSFCKLKNIKLSIASLQALDFESCNLLGSLLARQNIKITISQTMNRSNILKMFKAFDTDNKDYLELEQFIVGFDCMKQTIKYNSYNSSGLDDANENKEKSKDQLLCKNVFDRLAVRRLPQRDRIYFADFYSHLTAYNDKLCPKYDITQIDYPIHFVANYLID